MQRSCSRCLLVAGFILAGTSGLVRLGAADQGTQPLEQTSRRAYDLLAEGFGAGFNGPIPIVVDVNGDKKAPQRIFDGVQGLDGVASVAKPQFNDAGTVAIVFVTPTSAPQDEATDKLVDRLRGDVVPAATSGGDALAYVSGQTAAFKDIADQIISRMPIFLLFIIGVTFLVLAMAFRSIVVSATAAVTTLLSAFIGFGVLGLVVQQGHLLGLTGLDKTGPIETFVPPIAFAILFGLSMDYMVFIMSRIREEHVHGLDTRAAVEHGISAIGRVVVAAALIMGTVFAAFILSADRVPKEFGLLLAVAILTDALVVRMTLVPAFLTLMGEKSWYMPRWLDRVLPNITIEPPHDGEPVPARVGACARAGGRRPEPGRPDYLNGRQPEGMRESPRMHASKCENPRMARSRSGHCVRRGLVLVPAALADAASEDALAQKYAPVVRLVDQPEECGPGEPFIPTDVDVLFDEPTVAFRGPWNRTDLVKIAPSATDLANRYEHHLDFPGDPLDAGCDYELWARPPHGRYEAHRLRPRRRRIPATRGSSHSSTGSSTPSTTSTTPTRATGR